LFRIRIGKIVPSRLNGSLQQILDHRSFSREN
jgi:hypothetical protein